MKAIAFTLGGRTGFFKRPDVNASTYFTYNNIHKPALLGLLGAVAGFGGYNADSMRVSFDTVKNKAVKGAKKPEPQGLPEYYRKLAGLKVSITPEAKKGVFPKKIQKFNNSVGYASKEQGGNLVVSEQWLENPSWRIMIMNDGSLEQSDYDAVAGALLNSTSCYTPYLGKNDHTANISAVCETELTPASGDTVCSLFPLDDMDALDYDEDPEDANPYIFREKAPVALHPTGYFYILQQLALTNLPPLTIPANTYFAEGGNRTFI